MRRLVPAALLAVLTALLLAAAPAAGQSRTFGPSLAAPADAGWGCETRFIPGFAPGDEDQAFNIPGSTCTVFSSTRDAATTGFVPGSGTITKVRVRSGANPAPLKVSIIRRLVRPTKANPDIQDQCCLGQAESATVTPTPNAVTEIPVNLPVEVKLPSDTLSGWHDIVSVSAVGEGTLPIRSTGRHDAAAATAPNTPTVTAYYPHLAPGANRNNGEMWSYANWLLLMQYDWTACPGARTGQVARQGCAAAGGGTTTGAGTGATGTGAAGTGTATTTTVKPRAKVSSRSLRLTKGRRVSVRVACTRGDGQRCKGRVRLRMRGKTSRLLASRSMNVKDGRKATVRLTLGESARKRVKKKRTKVTVQVDLGAGQPKISRKLTLKR